MIQKTNSSYAEADYQRVAEPAGQPQFLAGTSIEIVRPLARRDPPRHVLFDFDGTLSLIREGWPEVMVPLMVEVLQATGTKETPAELSQRAGDFVMQLTGKQTIYQMIRLAEEVTKCGGVPLDPTEYKQMYHDRLLERIADRRQRLQAGALAPAEMVVPYSFELLDELVARGVAIYLASGTDQAYVDEEVRLLGLDRYFGKHVYGAIDDYKNFSKAMVIERILAQHQVDGTELLGFGDGYVEIHNIKAVGGTAVAVASDEAGRSGKPDPWKRDRLIGAGADLVIPDFREHRALIRFLWNED
jgi:phosphoglycolate phosphatase-like HAD superfamily hydrolase